MAATTLTNSRSLLSKVPDGQIYGTASITAAVTLTTADSNRIFTVTLPPHNGGAGAAYAITLPATATSKGVKYRFVVAAAAADNNKDVTIVADGAVIKGSGIQNATAGRFSGTTITIDAASAAPAQLAQNGDWIDLQCDGSYWTMFASAGTAASITIA